MRGLILSYETLFWSPGSCVPLPVFVVGTYDHNGKPNAMVATWGGICSSDPPSIAVSIRPSRSTYRNLMEKMAFTVSIPSEQYMAEADFFGMVSGDTMDKFAISGLTPSGQIMLTLPVLPNFL